MKMKKKETKISVFRLFVEVVGYLLLMHSGPIASLGLRQSHSSEKSQRGTLLDLLTYILLQNIKKLEEGPFGDIQNFSKKSRTVSKKKSKGGTLQSSPAFQVTFKKCKK